MGSVNYGQYESRNSYVGNKAIIRGWMAANFNQLEL